MLCSGGGRRFRVRLLLLFPLLCSLPPPSGGTVLSQLGSIFSASITTANRNAALSPVGKLLSNLLNKVGEIGAPGTGPTLSPPPPTTAKPAYSLKEHARSDFIRRQRTRQQTHTLIQVS